MENILLFAIELLFFDRVISFCISSIVPKLCQRIFKKKFGDLSQKKKYEVTLNASNLLVTSILFCVSVYEVFFDQNIRKPWGFSYVAYWNLSLAVEYSCAVALLRLKWKLKFYPSQCVHFVAVGVFGLVAMANHGPLYAANLRIVTILPVPFLSLRNILRELDMKSTDSYLVADKMIVFVSLLFRILYLPRHYISFYYRHELYSNPLLLYYVTFWWWLIGSLTFDLLNIYWFVKCAKGYFNVAGIFSSNKVKHESNSAKVR
ncbi:uncharacterized protein LOC143470091 [Clavelina lepadiformis]|uniref:TLC domain-containing protein n=1 Tax=Clavelina lepadiformis TaxID=159417 RepID=A0ABP0FLU7_CLALP